MMKAPQPEVVATASRQNPGETLRQAREQKGLSLSQVAGQLNLTENSLRQLENGAFDKLPGHTFSRGYIRAYAKLMGLDQAELVNSFDHFTGTNASGSTVQSLGRVAEPVRLSRNVLRIVSLLLLALLIGFGYFWWQEHSARTPETAGLSLEHVEVESADGTTEIHTLDEPEDQAVIEAQKEGEQAPAEVSPEVAAQAEGAPPVASEGAQVPAAPAQGTPRRTPAARYRRACRHGSRSRRCSSRSSDGQSGRPARAERTCRRARGGRRGPGGGQGTVRRRLLDPGHRRQRQGPGQRAEAQGRQPGTGRQGPAGAAPRFRSRRPGQLQRPAGGRDPLRPRRNGPSEGRTMSIHSASPIIRRKSRKIWVGNVPVGGDAPIAVQSMTNTETSDVAATVAQIRRLEDAGADIVRVSVPDMDAAEAFGKIKQQVNVPLVADIHFDYRIALRVAELGVDCLRINPGNIGREDRVKAVVDAARERNIPIRIGVNAGSLEKDLQKKYGEPTPEALLESAMRHVDHLDKLDFQNFKVSVKASDVFMAVAAYRLLARQIEQPLHLGITEAGGLRSGTVKSAVGLGMLLAEGIGDTIRISLAADPVEEIKVGFDILKSLHLRSRGINFIACPSCSRQNFDVVKTMNELEGRLEDLLVPMDVAVIGCVVNGPGEAKEAHVGLTGGTPNLVYIDGKPSQKLTNDNLVDELERLIRQKAAEKAEADASLIARG